MAGCQKGPGTPSRLDVKSGEARKKKSSGRHKQAPTRRRFRGRALSLFPTTLRNTVGKVNYFSAPRSFFLSGITLFNPLLALRACRSGSFAFVLLCVPRRWRLIQIVQRQFFAHGGAVESQPLGRGPAIALHALHHLIE
jgi:hypothetical protein